MNVPEYERILKKVGFTDIEITPVNIYTKEVMKSFTEEKELAEIYTSLDESVLDGAFAGAHVKAYK